MKRFLIFFMLVVLSSAFLAAEAESDTGLKIRISETMEEFSRAWLEIHPDPVSKQGIAVLEIENNSDKADRAKIGELVRAYLEDATNLSLIFVLTDRDNLKKIVDEIKFSASGMVSDDSAVEIGEITGTAALISGSVVEEAENFRISLKMTDIESGEVVTVTGFSLPQKDLTDASTELEYGYVAANGIGFSAKPLFYLYGADLFNKFKPVYLDVTAKYRISRVLMLSAGVFVNLLTTVDLYRWDPSFDSSHAPVTYTEIQPELPFAAGIGEIGQITGALSEATAFHIDLQYTVNFTPFFNIGLNAGIVSISRPVMTVLYGSSGGLYYNDTGYEPGGTSADSTAQIDNMSMQYIFEPLFGGKIEICPEFFITHRIALSGVAGYLYTLPSVLREVIASEGQWAYYDMAVESNFSQTAVDKYFGFDPVNMPGGGLWKIDLSGFYAGVALSIFF